jgi:superfamily II DNA/RNA helicase
MCHALVPEVEQNHIIRSCGKFELLDRMLPKLRETKHKVLIFTQMTKVLNLLEEYIRLKGWSALRLDGSTGADDRASMVQRFHDDTADNWIFLLTTRAGGLGLNLQGADTVIIFDSDWNPQMDLQAMDRAHRIGQTSEVRIFRLISNSPVETEMLARATQKLQMDDKIIQSAMFNNKHSAADESKRQERLRALVEADDKEAEDNEEESDVMSWEECNRNLARSDEEFDLFERMDEAMRSEEKATRRPRLMTEKECPNWLTKAQLEMPVEETDLGRGGRAHKEVQYSGVSDREFEKMMRMPSKKDEAVLKREEEGRQKYNKDKKAKREKRPKASEADIGVMTDVWNTVKSAKDTDGRERAALFLELPSQTDYPDYYQIIRHPVSLKEIKKGAAASPNSTARTHPRMHTSIDIARRHCPARL